MHTSSDGVTLDVEEVSGLQKKCFSLFLASQDALEVMYVSESVSHGQIETLLM